MNPSQFYTPFAEWGKILFYALLSVLLLIGLYKRFISKSETWYLWIDAAIYAHFIMGVFYSGLRMVATDEIHDIYVRRIFAWEAWFNGACGAFYFLFRQYINTLRNKENH